MTDRTSRRWIAGGTSLACACVASAILFAQSSAATTGRQGSPGAQDRPDRPDQTRPDQTIVATGCLQQGISTAGTASGASAGTAASGVPARGDTTSRTETTRRAGGEQYVLANARISGGRDPGSSAVSGGETPARTGEPTTSATSPTPATPPGAPGTAGSPPPSAGRTGSTSATTGTDTSNTMGKVGAAAGTSYLLTGLDPRQMQPHIGHQVEVQGRLAGRDPASGAAGVGRNAGTMGSTGTASGDRSAAAGTTREGADVRDLPIIHAASIRMVSSTCAGT